MSLFGNKNYQNVEKYICGLSMCRKKCLFGYNMFLFVCILFRYDILCLNLVALCFVNETE